MHNKYLLALKLNVYIDKLVCVYIVSCVFWIPFKRQWLWSFCGEVFVDILTYEEFYKLEHSQHFNKLYDC